MIIKRLPAAIRNNGRNKAKQCKHDKDIVLCAPCFKADPTATSSRAIRGFIVDED